MRFAYQFTSASGNWQKIGLNLIDADDIGGHHGTLYAVGKDNRFFLTTKENAEALGARLTKVDDKYPYYRL